MASVQSVSAERQVRGRLCGLFASCAGVYGIGQSKHLCTLLWRLYWEGLGEMVLGMMGRVLCNVSSVV